MPAPSYWANVGKSITGKLGGSTGSVWVIGGVWAGGICHLNFPSSASYPNVQFDSTDANELYLSYFDGQGISVILQVEPGNADIATLMKIVMDRYGSHPCVKGFGIDLEWYEYMGHAEGKPVTDEEATEWYRQLAAYDSRYELALTHWTTGHMPPTYRKGLLFLYDGLGMGSLDSAISYYSRWGNAYPGQAGFYIGFQQDRGWWSQYGDPVSTIGSAIKGNVPDVKGIYWVSFSVTALY